MSLLQVGLAAFLVAESKEFLRSGYDTASLLKINAEKGKDAVIMAISSYVTDMFIERVLPMLPLNTQALAKSQDWSRMFRSLATGALFSAFSAIANLTFSPSLLLLNLVLGMGAELASEKLAYVVGGVSLSQIGGGSSVVVKM